MSAESDLMDLKHDIAALASAVEELAGAVKYLADESARQLEPESTTAKTSQSASRVAGAARQIGEHNR